MIKMMKKKYATNKDNVKIIIFFNENTAFEIKCYKITCLAYCQIFNIMIFFINKKHAVKDQICNLPYFHKKHATYKDLFNDN